MNRFLISFVASFISISLHHPALAAEHKELVIGDGQGCELLCSSGIISFCSTIHVQSKAEEKAKDAAIVAAEEKCSPGLLEDEDDDKKLKSQKHFMISCGSYYSQGGPGILCRARFTGKCITEVEAPEREERHGSSRYERTTHYSDPAPRYRPRPRIHQPVQEQWQQQETPQAQQSQQSQDTGLIYAPNGVDQAQ